MSERRDPFSRALVPVASPDDARATARALADHDVGAVVVVYVVEKAGGAPDKASVEQREEHAEETFAAFRETFPDAASEVRYDRDVADAIIAAAADHDATAVVFVPREGSRWLRLLTGDVALSLVTDADRPVIALPRPDDE